MPSPRAAWAHETWTTYHGRKPTWLAKDYVALARLVKLPDFKTLWTTYLRCDEPFHRGHSPCRLLGSVERFREDALRLAAAVPLDPAEAAVVRVNRAMRNHWAKRFPTTRPKAVDNRADGA